MISLLTYSLHCSSFLGLPFRILNIDLVKPKKGTTVETMVSLKTRVPGVIYIYIYIFFFFVGGGEGVSQGEPKSLPARNPQQNLRTWSNPQTPGAQD